MSTIIPAPLLALEMVNNRKRFVHGKPAKRIVIGVWNYYEELNVNNRMFTDPQVGIGDNLLKPWNDFYSIARENGVDLVSFDLIEDFNTVDGFLFIDFPNVNNPLVRSALATSKPKYLIIYETEVIRPENWSIQNHALFRRIFTWNDTWIDNDKYLKINYAQDIPASINKALESKVKFCALIAGNKTSNHPNELYSSRVAAIRWFEQHHPELFDLYGIGWSQAEFPSYRGRVDSKYETLRQYKFSICYENASDYPGYITEKIFDCFKAGCVPVYLGAPNIDDHIPQACYIDKRHFDSYESLYSYLTSLSEEDYLQYLDNIELFFQSVAPYQFGSEYFSYPFDTDQFVWTLLGELSKDVAHLNRSEPLVSVVIPSYNYGRYLPEAIESVLSQGIDDLELVILDNASTDETPEKVKPFLGDSRVRYIRHSRNIGGYNNWNRCLQIATGKYVVVLSADDYFCPGHLHTMLESLEEHPECSLAYGPCDWVDESSKSLGVLNHQGHPAESYIGGRDELVDLLIYDNYITPSAAILRRSALRYVGYFDSRIRGAIDWDLWVRIASQNKNFIFIKDPGVCYRVHENQDSNGFYASLFPLKDHLSILEKVLTTSEVHRIKNRTVDILALLCARIAAYPADVVEPLAERIFKVTKALESLGSEVMSSSSANPLVSVIVPTYNRPDLLMRALQSIINQTYSNIEIVVVNDGGIDVGNILNSLGDDLNIVLIQQSEHKGVSVARNVALRAARGEIITYLDDDDVFLHAHISTVVNGLQKDCGPFLYTKSEYVIERLESGKLIEISRNKSNVDVSYHKERLHTANYIPINTWGHLKSIFGKVGYFDESLDNHEDWDFLLKCSRNFDFFHIPVVTVQVHQRETSDNALRREKHKFYDTFKLIYSRYDDLGSVAVATGREQMLSCFLPGIISESGVLSTDRADYERAELLLESGQQNEGVALLEALAEKGSSCWEVYNDLAVLYLNGGDNIRAAPCFQKGIALEGKSGTTARNFATMLLMTGDMKGALAVLGSILREQPQDAGVLDVIRDILSEINPISPDVWLNLVSDLRCEHRPEQNEFLEVHKPNQHFAKVDPHHNDLIEKILHQTTKTSSNEIKIFQVYYDDATKAKVDPSFIPLDNSQNLRPDWSEYWPIRNVLLNQSFEDDTYLGFFSPQFFDKTGMDGNEVLENLRYVNDEIISFSPYFDQSAFYDNPFIQGERYHPGLIKITQNVLSLLNIKLQLDSLICDQTTTIFSNYFVARYSFWKKWFDYAEKIFEVCEGPDCDLKTSLISTTVHRGHAGYPMKVFVLERLVTIVMEELRISSRVGIDISKSSLSSVEARENFSGLVIRDALKGQYRKTGLSVYKDILFGFK
jgi:glycosyltransferase involved in cell wall biosynthesis